MPRVVVCTRPKAIRNILNRVLEAQSQDLLRTGTGEGHGIRSRVSEPQSRELLRNRAGKSHHGAGFQNLRAGNYLLLLEGLIVGGRRGGLAQGRLVGRQRQRDGERGLERLQGDWKLILFLLPYLSHVTDTNTVFFL